MRLNTRIFSSVSTKSIIVGGVITLACLAFIFTGFGTLKLSDLGDLSSNTAAQIDSEVVDMQQFATKMYEQNAGNIPPERRKMIAQQVINQLIQQKILVIESKKIGWNVDDSEIISFIRSIPGYQNPSTGQFDISLFKNYMTARQTNEIAFYAYLKEQLEIQKIENLLQMPIPYSDKINEIQHKINSTEFTLQYAVIAADDAILKSKIEESAQKYLSNTANLDSLKKTYESENKKFHQEAKIKALTMLVSYKTATRPEGEGIHRTKEEALEVAKQLHTKLLSGVRFAPLASQTNDDLSAKKSKGDIGFIDNSNMDPKSVEAVYKLTKENPISDIVETQFGFRLFKYVEMKPAINQSFDDVKLQLASEVVSSQIKVEATVELEKQLTEKLLAKNSSHINEILQQNKLSWVKLSKNFKTTDPFISELGPSTELATQVFSLKKPGDILPQLVRIDNKKILFKLTSLKVADAQTEKEKEDFAKQHIASLTQEFSQAAITSMTEKYQKSGKIKINSLLFN